jgi:hypothetical protein
MNSQTKSFEEIETELLANLKKIKLDILDMERNIGIGKEMLDAEIEKNPQGEAIFKYKNDLAELETGLGIFQHLETQMKQTLDSLYDTMKKADDYMK